MIEIDYVGSTYPFAVGDIITVDGGVVTILTQNQSRASKFQARILDPRRVRAMKTKSLVEGHIRHFFTSQNFHEVTTPTIVRSPGMETHIEPFQLSKTQFLPTSPELSMKKLLVGGLEKIFQICSAFRNEPFSHHHRPEFTMLEFYRGYSDDEAIQKDIENLIESLALKIHGSPIISYGNQKIDLTTPWPRLRISDLFLNFGAIDLKVESSLEKLRSKATQLKIRTEPSDTWDDIYFRIWIEHIEPELPTDRAVFVTHYPASQAALARIDEHGWAKRFEAYIGGIELCNGYDELTDAGEQRRRFEQSGRPIDEEFLSALEEGMPPSGGVALGVDRLVMLMADESDIEYCFWLNPTNS